MSWAINFSDKVCALRKARGMTQYDLADAIGTTQRTISYYENEGGHPQAPVMAHLAQALNVSTDELLGVKKSVRTSQAKKAAANHEDPEIRRVWKKFQQLMTLPEKD
jgi:transcriptional regulator with XRE-family HTH domain